MEKNLLKFLLIILKLEDFGNESIDFSYIVRGKHYYYNYIKLI